MLILYELKNINLYVNLYIYVYIVSVAYYAVLGSTYATKKIYNYHTAQHHRHYAHPGANISADPTATVFHDARIGIPFRLVLVVFCIRVPVERCNLFVASEYTLQSALASTQLQSQNLYSCIKCDTKTRF